MKLGEWMKSINKSKNDLYEQDSHEADKSYSAFIVNRCLSYHIDTILYAEELNRHHWIPKKAQYKYLLYAVRPKYRYAEWQKNDNMDDLKVIMECYNCSISKANEYYRILNNTQLQACREKISKGGVNK